VKVRALVVFISLFLLGFQLPRTRAQQPMGENRIRRGPPCWVPEDLRLTPEQVEEMKSLERYYLGEMTALRNQLRDRRYTLRRRLMDPAVDPSEIRAKQKEVLALEDRIQEKILDYQLRVREILTPEQFRLWASRKRWGLGRRLYLRRRMGVIRR